MKDEISRERILEISKTTIPFPLAFMSKDQERIISVMYVNNIAQPDPTGVPSAISVIRERANGNKTYSTYQLVESQTDFDDKKMPTLN